MLMENRNAQAAGTNQAQPRRRNVLVVEDDRTMRLFVVQQLQGLGYEVIGVDSGEAAIELLERSPQSADVVLLDRTLPGMDGTEFVRRCRADRVLQIKPIIMLTGASQPSEIKSGVDAGVFYYLAKPIDVTVLQSVVASAMRRIDTTRKLLKHIDSCKAAMSHVQSAKFTFRTHEEAQDLATLLSGSFPNPERVVLGIAELMINAIEHGNLEIGYDKKSELVNADSLQSELKRRHEMPEYANRTAQALVTRKPEGTYLVISDEGPGFNPREFISLDPARATKRSGRGIAQARNVSFDKVTYNAKGNQVLGFVSNDVTIEW